MRVKFSQVVEQFFTPRAFFPFLIGSISMAVIGNEVARMLEKLVGETGRDALKITVGAVFVLAFCVGLLHRWLSRVEPQPVDFKQRKPDFRRGLILMVSKPETCRKAIEYHLPILERCWLLCSVQSLEVAEALRNEFRARLEMPAPVVVNDVNNPLEFTDRVNEIYGYLPEGWSDDEVIADYTGMTAHASVGMALACLAPARPLQYTPGRYDAGLKAVSPLDPIEIAIWRNGEPGAGS